ncbi:transposase [Vibrio sp. HA2012]|uniref:transposase n=1 Tax=Vibrio sp. HA2012 TaxID=1971595 RepID=UPI000C2C6332|nr:transposase [Vibrio sp. HA2012]PJC86390.1 transposase [Vibrio sp. HA2012]
MTTARKQQICLEATPYYHCVSRCVRRTFLCGYDEVSQKNYEHRREWIETRIKQLATIYCIDICAYAVMSNHYHIVVHINQEKAKSLTEREVIKRWSMLHARSGLIQRFLNYEALSKQELCIIKKIAGQWRQRLFSLSWFMRELNFEIALKANQEDECTGHFWESRYKSQALLDDKALLAAMAYVDLNPIRAGISKTPETSDYTSIKERIHALKNNQPTALCLHPFIGSRTKLGLSGIPFLLLDYIALVDQTGRVLCDGKSAIGKNLPPILARLNVTDGEWLQICSGLERKRALLIGHGGSLKAARSQFRRKRVCGYQFG